eukprot:TRINITY_DN4683_c0_g1_i4.p1 TRINITY_DN4683_c0_g1~~TRINITY_DN4683_c0_g1_i4.p1  ORF type:complete len:675 (-),score=129.16 TRINITY_DN4683_c0_g1_i4:44-2068(-)
MQRGRREVNNSPERPCYLICCCLKNPLWWCRSILCCCSDHVLDSFRKKGNVDPVAHTHKTFTMSKLCLWITFIAGFVAAVLTAVWVTLAIKKNFENTKPPINLWQINMKIQPTVDQGVYDEFDRSGFCGGKGRQVQAHFAQLVASSLIPALSSLNRFMSPDGNLPPLSNNSEQVFTTVLCNAERLVKSDYERTDFQEMGFRIRIYGKLMWTLYGTDVFDQINAIPERNLDDNCVYWSITTGFDGLQFGNSSSASSDLQCDGKDWVNFLHLMLLKIERVMFNWKKKDYPPSRKRSWVMDHLEAIAKADESVSRGITLFGGEPHVEYLLTLIHSIRDIHQCDLPIDVFYLGPRDMSVRGAKLIRNSAANVHVIDLLTILDASSVGWDSKPLVLLASRFKETMFIDADVVLLQSPDVFFSQRAYLQYDALFFNDRTVGWRVPSGGDDTTQLIELAKYVAPELQLSGYAADTRVGRKVLTNHEMESGVIVVNQHERIIGLLAAAKLLDKMEKDLFYEGAWGDKEAFWLGMEMARQPYGFVNMLPGSIGFRNLGRFWDGVCGRLLHFDDNEEPMWWNGGYKVVDKGRNDHHHAFWSYLTRQNEELWYDDGGRKNDPTNKIGEWDLGPQHFCVSESERKPRKFQGYFWLMADKAVAHQIMTRRKYRDIVFGPISVILTAN